ncbi:uncharacterized protein LOC120077244 [Benincasa hispida]|uniref:uncharacterized protein LOC120077244 n=1 Tax=Benincasa hispida TaxID=102211 RepID=UPI00190264CD|nr:uncharacterized protein LOC120077244 [Benincasa hispida]
MLSVNGKKLRFDIIKAMKYPEDEDLSDSDNEPSYNEKEESEDEDEREVATVFVVTYNVIMEKANKEEKLTLNEKKKAQQPFLEQPPTMELETLPSHLKYVFLGQNETLPVIFSSMLQEEQENVLHSILRKYIKAIGWTLADIRGISLAYCMHRIHLEENQKGYVKLQCRLNPTMKKVVKKKIIKWLDAGIIYPIADSTWVNPMQCYNQIMIAPEDQEKTTFTCPYGMLAFHRMSFELCNASSTFQRYMMDIFSKYLEDSVEIFMDDFSIYGQTYEICLNNLEKILRRCEETNLVLNWEKCTSW